jgi:hypothetical protein
MMILGRCDADIVEWSNPVILRRLREKIRRQDWFSVGLEVSAVVFGVFLALQAENWNEWRIERAEEREYLIRLYDDINNSISMAHNVIDYMKLHAERADVVLKSLKSCRIAEADQLDFANGLFQLGNVVPPYLVGATITELRSTGKETVIRSSDVRHQLSELINKRDYYESFFSAIVDRLAPHVVYVQSHVIYTVDSFNAGAQSIIWEDVEFDLEKLCKDRRFFTAVSASRTYTYDTIYWNKLGLGRLEAFAEALRTELTQLGLIAD